MKLHHFQTGIVALGVSLALPALAQEEINLSDLPSPFAAEPYSPNLKRGYPTEVFFGDTHVHTALSGDAGGAGTTLLPRDAYRFARGEEVRSNTGQPVRLARPFDFYMITDHSDGMGSIVDIINGTPNVMADPFGAQLHRDFNSDPDTATKAALRMISAFAQGTLPPALSYKPGDEAYKRVWNEIVDAAEEFNDPGHFTTFIAFEWTSLVAGNNLHRNVIFRDNADKAGQVVPYTTVPPLGSPNPRDLWAWMQSYEDSTGGDVLAISHNGNLSSGMMFPLVDDFNGGVPLDAEYARLRQKWEPLFEVTQIKGTSEAHPLLSPTDEFAGFEIWDNGNLDLSIAKTPEMLPGEYARAGLLRGLTLDQKLGENPFKFGMAGGTDTHTGLSTVDNDNYFGKFASYEPSPERVMHISQSNPELGLSRMSWISAASGITAVWATENTREAIWDAMARRETFATTGPRITVRLFGGWTFAENDVLRRDLVDIGYQRGVPMGADLQPAPDGAAAPRFLVFAMRDPIGANLDRIQIVKGWVDAEGGQHERVYDVAWSDGRVPGADGKLPPVGSTVDLTIPSWTNTIGAAELGAVWEDPDFDPAHPAFYYARVIEIPTPRWPAYDAIKFKLDLPAEVALVSQERAYTSPIWYGGVP